MRKSVIHFPKALNLHEFFLKYGAKPQCREELFRLVLVEGIRLLPAQQHRLMRTQYRNLFQCHRYHGQASLNAGTIFHGARFALTKRLLTIYRLTQRKKSVSAL